ncbi:uncharacterized protein N7443_000094 [Penicillium atrosanguineum]|uniref:Reverse transcriptase n=1 Tax=Penicillium atrosanguineum TaxID=1132637 RepID=A0A9W9QAT8_9EURO|nr:uncharacterized protein N7443_000094 [Penicillium atrosanguineum]KAJ5313210.1 hypothetical protein N7443_000094 [Penicillium atrosanguineum]KAJ5330314.1 reverse transcriptase [Penicillium atrosanguineum]
MATYSQALAGRFHVLLRLTIIRDGREDSCRPRVCFYINKKINPKAWSVQHYSRDVSTLSVKTALGVAHIHNVYVQSKVGSPEERDRATGIAQAALTVLHRAMQRGRSDHHIVVGDFNLHHPLWSKPRQAQMRDDDANELVNLMGDYGLELLTERGMTTVDGAVYGSEVQSTLDLTWASTPLADRCARCQDQPQWLFIADHIPVLTELDL